MFRWISNAFKIAFVFTIVAYVLNLHYQGVGARDYIKDKGFDVMNWVYYKGKGMMNKDVEDLIPNPVPKIKKEVQELNPFKEEKPKVQKEEHPKPKAKPEKQNSENKTSVKTENLTENDRKSLQNLVQAQQIKKN